ncbi:MAG: hypothetical protein MK082_03725 [Phycisphaerales bacterium]|nr:hypothetical protein [Phycisphaerales bacterium]
MAIVQVILGLRSLIVKSAIFFIMAALLAWALGGTLFPRPEVVDFGKVSFKGGDWWLRMLAGGDQPGAVRWYLMEHVGGKTFEQPHLHQAEDSLVWLDAVGPVAADNVLYVGYQTARDGWQIAVFEQIAPVSRIVPALDRLSVERQFARVENGLPLQERDEERALREDLIELGDEEDTSSD